MDLECDKHRVNVRGVFPLGNYGLGGSIPSKNILVTTHPLPPPLTDPYIQHHITSLQKDVLDQGEARLPMGDTK